MRASIQRWIPLALVVLAALWLRTRDLAARPMHADEANQAVKLGELLDRGRYVFDPHDHHGPTLYYFALPLAWLRGERSLASLDETTVRLLPALAGTLSVLLLALFAAPLGRWPALAAAGFLAVSPPAVYYSRYFIQETLLVTFTLAMLVCAQRWWRSGRLGWALATGACVGLMQATKANAPLFVVAALLALWPARFAAPASRRLARDCSLAWLTALAVAALFYSSFGTHLAGVRDALATYDSSAGRLVSGRTGHEKPWWYYLRLFAWQREGGVVFDQVAFSALALVGAAIAVVTRHSFLRWSLAYAVLVAIGISAPAYKTPWHAVHFVPGLALLAAGALGALHRRPATRIVALVAAIVVPAALVYRTWQVAFVRPGDTRNPFAYVHSSPDVLKFRALADAAVAAAPGQPVRIVSEEYWPLPWYLRGLPRVGYWSTPPAECDGAMVIASADLAGAVRAKLHGKYHESFLGLRPGFVCVVFVKNTPER